MPKGAASKLCMSYIGIEREKQVCLSSIEKKESCRVPVNTDVQIIASTDQCPLAGTEYSHHTASSLRLRALTLALNESYCSPFPSTLSLALL